MATVAWLVGRPVAGSGGQATVFARARALERAGHRCIFHLPANLAERAEAMTDRLVAWHGLAADQVRFGRPDTTEADLVMVSDWGGLAVARTLAPRRLAHFVQDIEASFRPVGDETLGLETGPLVGATAICLGRWLHASFVDRYGRDAFVIDFGADPAIYHPGPERPREERVACIHQPDKQRRCPETALQALRIVKAARPQTAISLFGSDEPLPEPMDGWSHGMLAPADLADLYRRCRVGFCISATNPSRIPFEMMACGLPVVEIYRTNTLLDLPEDGALLALQTAHSLADAILLLLERPDAADRLGAVASRWMAPRTAAREDGDFVAAVAAILEGRPPAAPAPAPVFARKPVVASADRSIAASLFLERQRQEALRLAAGVRR